jgi:hypothetical protein
MATDILPEHIIVILLDFYPLVIDVNKHTPSYDDDQNGDGGGGDDDDSMIMMMIL